MATNQDFDDLITRIDTATDGLEQAVALVEGGVSNVTQASTVAQQAAVNAQQAAVNAQQSTVDATQQASIATQQANSAQQSATAAQDALDAIQNGEWGSGIEEAPKDGRQYARKDGAWATITVEGGSGVQSVNDILPDEQGNVTLPIPAAPTKLSELTNDTQFITANDLPTPPTVPTKLSELTNDEGFITADDLPPQQEGIEEAPNDGKGYVRKNESWVEETIGGGSSKPAYESSVSFGGVSYTVAVNRPMLALSGKECGALDILTTKKGAPNYGVWSDMLVAEVDGEWKVDSLPLPDKIMPIEAFKITTSTGVTSGFTVNEGFNPSTGDITDGELSRIDDNAADLIGLGTNGKTLFALPVGKYFVNFCNYYLQPTTTIGTAGQLQERNQDGKGVLFCYGVITVEESVNPILGVRDDDTPNKHITLEVYRTTTSVAFKIGVWVYSTTYPAAWVKLYGA